MTIISNLEMNEHIYDIVFNDKEVARIKARASI
jgi:hypothetical protein